MRTSITFTTKENGCPIMVAKKGNVSIIAEGNFILSEAIIEHDGKLERITDEKIIYELNEKTFTKEEHDMICRLAQSY
jgi:hypothetical protein